MNRLWDFPTALFEFVGALPQVLNARTIGQLKQLESPADPDCPIADSIAYSLAKRALVRSASAGALDPQVAFVEIERAAEHLSDRWEAVNAASSACKQPVLLLMYLREIQRCSFALLKLHARHKAIAVVNDSRIRLLGPLETTQVQLNAFEIICRAATHMSEIFKKLDEVEVSFPPFWPIENQIFPLHAYRVVFHHTVGDDRYEPLWEELTQRALTILESSNLSNLTSGELNYVHIVTALMSEGADDSEAASDLWVKIFDSTGQDDDEHQVVNVLLELMRRSRDAQQIRLIFDRLRELIDPRLVGLGSSERILLASRIAPGIHEIAYAIAISDGALASEILDWAATCLRDVHPPEPTTPLVRLLLPEGAPSALALVQCPDRHYEVIPLPALNLLACTTILRGLLGASSRSSVGTSYSELRKALAPLLERLDSLPHPVSVETYGVLGWLPLHAVRGQEKPLCGEAGISYRHPRHSSLSSGPANIDLLIIDESFEASRSLTSLGLDAVTLLFNSDNGPSLSPDLVQSHLEQCAGFLYYGHGSHRFGEIEESCLDLGSDDHKLTLTRLLATHLQADCVGVIVACSSGRVEPFLSLPMSIAFAAAIAGCSEVIGNLWDISGDDGAEFARTILLNAWTGQSCRTSWERAITKDPYRFGSFVFLG